MSRAAVSVFLFGLYLVPVGFGLLIVPHLLLDILGFNASSEFWPRVVGVLTLAIAAYYIRAARAGLTEFFRWSAEIRVGVFVLLVALVLWGVGPMPLAVLGAVDLLGAIWTFLALKSEIRA